MDSSGVSSIRSDRFPAGLRVLVVDDDPTWSKILEKMLKKCNYQVTTCNLAREALFLLRQRKDGFDIVISDVNMPDMDGFKLLELVGLEMDLPVIMMSVDGETSRVMRGVRHGACDYLLKPIRMKELRNIWQHVLRKRVMQDIREMECVEGINQLESGYLFSGDYAARKRKIDFGSSSIYDDVDFSDASSSSCVTVTKRPRVVWTVDLHQKFVRALNQIGSEKAGPKKILDLMGVPWLTRENVASHLQKYRLFLSRLEKENEMKAAFAANIGSNGDACLRSLSAHNSPCIQQSTLLKENSAFSGEISFNPQVSEAKSKPLMQLQCSWNSDENCNNLQYASNVLPCHVTSKSQAIEQVAKAGSVPAPCSELKDQMPLVYEPAFGSWNNFDAHSYRDEFSYIPCSDLQNVGSLGCSDDHELAVEVQPHLHYTFDPLFIGQDLYIA